MFCHVLTAYADCLLNIVLYLMLLKYSTLHDAAKLFRAFLACLNFAFSCSVFYILCVLFVVLMANFKSG